MLISDNDKIPLCYKGYLKGQKPYEIYNELKNELRQRILERAAEDIEK